MEIELLKSLIAHDSLWVFAYGSLLWKPCFKYSRQVVGHIKGFKRRFYQGNTNLRGTPAKPGRVAILVPDPQEVTWGVAYEIRGRLHVEHALQNLYVRENTCGGYEGMQVTFHPRPSNTSDDCPAFDVLCFTATPSSHLYMGAADVTTMALEVVAARGTAGPNTEYVLRTAEYVHHHIPEDKDQHLLELELAIRQCLLTLHLLPEHALTLGQVAAVV
ncbi:glutathione-specific gamma-glutamylcyclotransferase 1-like [Pomacea canaliculata]|nr:glutathione-specific gamma-glutamylcyclotransferase 1-like [Pomacea canaliculata]